MRRALVLALVLVACSAPAPGPSPPAAPATWKPPEGVACVYSGGQLVLEGHNHPDCLLRVAGCEGCVRALAQLADQVALARMRALAVATERRLAQLAPVTSEVPR